MPVELRTPPFDPWRELAAYETGALRAGGFGATAAFTGTMRDFNDDASVQGMFLEHYPGMTERELERIIAEACAQQDVLDILVLHRVGEIRPGEPIVLVAVWSAHRAEAFSVCREVMEALKSRAPFWKHERTPDGTRWVEQNTPGGAGRPRSKNAGVE